MRLLNVDARTSTAGRVASASSLVPGPADRLVALGPHGQWEVRTPDAAGVVLRAGSRATAVQWAWNITQDTGGRVLLS